MLRGNNTKITAIFMFACQTEAQKRDRLTAGERERRERGLSKNAICFVFWQKKNDTKFKECHQGTQPPLESSQIST